MVTIKEKSARATSLVLEPNKSLSAESHAGIVVGGLLIFGLFSFAFVVIGVWMVIPFIALEFVLLASVLGVVQVRCSTKERLLIDSNFVVVDKLVKGRSWAWRFDRAHLSLLVVRDEMDAICHITLCGTAGLVEVGEFLTESELKGLLKGLKAKGLHARNPSFDGVMSC
jgi:uncharacterized membrane protein